MDITETAVFVKLAQYRNIDVDSIKFVDNRIAVGSGLSLSANTICLRNFIFEGNIVDLAILELESASYAAIARTNTIEVR